MAAASNTPAKKRGKLAAEIHTLVRRVDALKEQFNHHGASTCRSQITIHPTKRMTYTELAENVEACTLLKGPE
eukprot:5939711-Prorocentrum_lima.AAC.1